MKNRWLKILAWLLLIGVLVLLAYMALPRRSSEVIAFADPYHVARPVAQSSQYMAVTGTPWATDAAIQMLEQGGNAVDAAVAALLALNVTYGEAASFPGVAPVLVYNAGQDRVLSYTGAGTAPAAATIEKFTARGWEQVPENDIWAQLLPASPDVIVALLSEQGTLSFADVSAPAIRLALDGFPVHQAMLNNLDLNFIERFGFNLLMPYNVQVYLDGKWWQPLFHGERFRRPELADTLTLMVQAEQQALAQGADRRAALQAVRSEFYQGAIAQKIVAFHQQAGGLFSAADLANYQGHWEEPLAGQYGPYTIYANQTWSQGGVVPLTLQILDGIDLKALGHNSPEYVHTVLQALELAIADREAYFADPAFVDAPLTGLFSPAYAAARRSLLTPGKSFGQLPPPGDPWAYQGQAQQPSDHSLAVSTRPALSSSTASLGKDTSYVAIVDAQGNAVSLTPSDFPQTPMVPGTGLTLGNRMNQFYLDPAHPDALQPGKRPRITPNPSLVLKDGELFMVLGTPGGDTQAQVIVQVFLNIVVFGMDPQQAVEAPRFESFNFPDSFAPHTYLPGEIGMEQSLYTAVGKPLEAMGYKIQVDPDWDNDLGAACVILYDPDTGALQGGADPREASWAQGK